jgi:membrane-associated phospholipid phosphatase
MRDGLPLWVHVCFGSLWLMTIAAFVALAVEVDGRYYLRFDLRPTKEVQDLAIEQRWADRAFDATNGIGHLESVALVLGACIVLCVLRRLWLEAALFVGAGLFGAVQYTLRETIHRPFPGFDNSPDPVEVFPVGDSFPSGHVFGEVVLYGLIFVLADRLFVWWPLVWVARIACLAIIVTGMPARLATGSHWPSDVIGAALLALIYLIPATWLYVWSRSRDAMPAARRVEFVATA